MRKFVTKNYPIVEIDREMIQAAQDLVAKVRVERTIASPIDTLTGILGEFIFAHYFYGSWKKHQVGKNKGESDFPDIEIKTSAFPFSERLNLLVRQDYARKRKPAFYIQIILNVPSAQADQVTAGTKAYLCGFALASEVDQAPEKDFGSKSGYPGGYLCHYIPIRNLHHMADFQAAYKAFKNGKPDQPIMSSFEDYYYLGNRRLLDQNPLGVFGSRSSSQALIGEACRLMQAIVKTQLPLAGGWQSKIEKEVLTIRRSTVHGPLVFFMAKGLRQFKPDSYLQKDLEDNKLLIISLWKDSKQISSQMVRLRNELILKKLDRFLFLSLRKGGNLDQFFNWALLNKKIVYVLEHTNNSFWLRNETIALNRDNFEILLS